MSLSVDASNSCIPPSCNLVAHVPPLPTSVRGVPLSLHGDGGRLNNNNPPEFLYHETVCLKYLQKTLTTDWPLMQGGVCPEALKKFDNVQQEGLCQMLPGLNELGVEQATLPIHLAGLGLSTRGPRPPHPACGVRGWLRGHWGDGAPAPAC